MKKLNYERRKIWYPWLGRILTLFGIILAVWVLVFGESLLGVLNSILLLLVASVCALAGLVLILQAGRYTRFPVSDNSTILCPNYMVKEPQLIIPDTPEARKEFPTLVTNYLLDTLRYHEPQGTALQDYYLAYAYPNPVSSYLKDFDSFQTVESAKGNTYLIPRHLELPTRNHLRLIRPSKSGYTYNAYTLNSVGAIKFDAELLTLPELHLHARDF